jgi:PEP-CTERM motif
MPLFEIVSWTISQANPGQFCKHQFMKKSLVVLTLLLAVSMSFGATIYWNPVTNPDDFADAANWSATYTSTSDSMRVGRNASGFANSPYLAQLTTGWGAVDSTENDQLLVGAYGQLGNWELACGNSTAYFRNVIVGDTKASATEGDSTMTITSGTIANHPDPLVDTGYMTIGRNNTAGSLLGGVGYLYVNGGTVAMDRITVGELRAGNTVAGAGHIVLQNNGVINLACQRVFTPTANIGLKLNNGDFTWNDNGSSSLTTGALSVNIGTLIFQSADNSFGTDGKGIVVNSGMPSGDGTAIFSAGAWIDVTGLADTSDWVTLITAAGGMTFSDTTLLTDASIAEGWGYRTLDLDGEAGSATALQVSIPEPATLSLLSIGALFLLRRKQ